jgi:hypothetical protein
MRRKLNPNGICIIALTAAAMQVDDAGCLDRDGVKAHNLETPTIEAQT